MATNKLKFNWSEPFPPLPSTPRCDPARFVQSGNANGEADASPCENEEPGSDDETFDDDLENSDVDEAVEPLVRELCKAGIATVNVEQDIDNSDEFFIDIEFKRACDLMSFLQIVGKYERDIKSPYQCIVDNWGPRSRRCRWEFSLQVADANLHHDEQTNTESHTGREAFALQYGLTFPDSYFSMVVDRLWEHNRRKSKRSS